ncbi:MAG: glycosyltransferase [Myxococcales bacterium]|nr:glycosyltransferase [Myxococcales bacterium]
MRGDDERLRSAQVLAWMRERVSSATKRPWQSQVATHFARAAALGRGADARGGSRIGRATLILPPSTPGSLGDEAMMAVCFERLAEEQGARVGVVDFTSARAVWPGAPEGLAHVSASGYFGAGHLRSLPRLVRALRGYDRLWCLGADVLDGHYAPAGSVRRITLAHVAAELGLEVTVLGFSVNATPDAEALAALSELPPSVRLCLRDPVSHARSLAALGRPVVQAADLAFDLAPAASAPADVGELLAWIHARRDEGCVVVGLNASHRSLIDATGASPAAVAERYASELSAALSADTGDRPARPRLAFVLVPHDYRDHPPEASDAAMTAEILARLDPGARARVRAFPGRATAALAKRVAGAVDVVVSGRLHFAIAALGEGTPAATVSYQGKLDGLYANFGLEGLAVAPETALAPGGLRAILADLVARRVALRTEIAARLPSVRARCALNFERCAHADERPTLLVVSPEPTHPTHKGNRARILDLCDRIEARGWDVHFACIDRIPGDQAAMGQRFDGRYHPVPYRSPVGVRDTLRRRLRGAVFGDHGYRIDDWYDPAAGDFVREISNEYDFDVVMIEYAHQSRMLEDFPSRALKVLDTHDSLADRFDRAAEVDGRRVGFSTSGVEEARAFARADVVVAIQDRERDEMATRTQTPVVTIGHRVRVRPTPRPDPCGGRVLFVGSANHANVAGARFLLEQVAPRLWEIEPGATLVFAGPICGALPGSSGAGADGGRVERLGIVDDLAAVYEAADVAVVPVLFGTGLKIKTIEALGFGVPTVTTSVGAEGLEAGVGRAGDDDAFVVADGAARFADAVSAVLQDGALRARLAAAALRFAAEWNAESERALDDLLARALVRAGRHPSGPPSP